MRAPANTKKRITTMAAVISFFEVPNSRVGSKVNSSGLSIAKGENDLLLACQF
jgi:hypothetical protein